MASLTCEFHPLKHPREIRHTPCGGSGPGAFGTASAGEGITGPNGGRSWLQSRRTRCITTCWRLKNDERVFENAFQGISRMILDSEIEKVVVNGKTTYDFKIFRQGKKHIVGMYDEINSFVSYVKDAAEGGSSAEMAYVLVGEPGNGKTFFVEYVSRLYREFLTRRSQPQVHLPLHRTG